MREIKFRSFVNHPDGKYVVYYSDPLFPHIFWNNVYKGIFDTNPEQYTGLKDKSEKEIYEGDILNFKWPNEDCDLGKIIFSRGCFMVNRFSKFGMDNVMLSIVCGKSEIIGNIYENPELLEAYENEK